MDSGIHSRRSIRLRGYDYGRPGAYFLTICTHNRQSLFGSVLDGQVRPNNAGLMVRKWYDQLGQKFTGLHCDEFICMPDHIHAVIFIEHPEFPLPKVVQWLKTMTTNDYIQRVKEQVWPPFDGRLWQRNYWERIIRDELELKEIREYIQTNPLRWEMRTQIQRPYNL